VSTLGQKPATQHVSTEKQSITGNGGTSYTLQQSVSQAADIEVFVNNTRQEPTVAYTASGTTLTMTGAVNPSDSFYVIFQGKAIQTAGLPVDAAITASTITVSQKLNIVGTTTPPSGPSAGDLWFNSATSTVSAVSSKALAVYNGNAWNQMSNLFSTTGGTESTYSLGGTNYKAHTFTSSGTFTVSGFSGSVEVLIIAGGGGGGGHSGGGGGAGGLLYYGAETPKTPNGAAISVTPQSYSIVVGGGGAGSGAPYNSVDGRGVSGSNSSAFGYTSIGGGGGGTANSSGLVGRDGGSGGGGSRHTAGGSATSGQGNNGGGPGPAYNAASYPGSGGGGAGAAGSAGATNAGGAGGVGLQYSISGSATYYAGGGGGTLQDAGGGDKGAGGNGGGGAGRDTAQGEAGTANTGGGGGGGYYGSGTGGGAGGSGVVIIRYSI